ncbi:MAG: hypothetical protein HY721_27000 [Planctomycetes bacterium]|nr:hypothetical protein [Planctomycetota bacterium]
MRDALKNKWLTVVSCLVLGGFFVVASAHKIADPPDFAKTVHNYKLVPWYLINLVAIFLPWFELLAGLAVGVPALVWLLPRALKVEGKLPVGPEALARTDALRLGGVIGLAFLSAVFIAALGYNLYRGHPTFCGCFSTFEGVGKHMTEAEKFWQMKREVLVNAGLILLAFQILHASRRGAPERASEAAEAGLAPTRAASRP